MSQNSELTMTCGVVAQEAIVFDEDPNYVTFVLYTTGKDFIEVFVPAPWPYYEKGLITCGRRLGISGGESYVEEDDYQQTFVRCWPEQIWLQP